MEFVYDNGTQTISKEDVQETNFYEEVAKLLKNEQPGKRTILVTVTTDHGKIRYGIRERSGTLCVTEEANSVGNLCQNLKPRFLTCIIPEKNAYKFYKLEPNGKDDVKASWGRMGVNKGDLFGERTCIYPASMYYVKYYEKLSKGYIDRTEVYLPDNPTNAVGKKATGKAQKPKQENPASSELYSLLLTFAKNAIKKARVSVPVTEVIVEEAKKLIDNLRKAKDVDAFNKIMLELMAILQRPVRTGDGMGVFEMLAKSQKDFAQIILREADLLQAMQGTLHTSSPGTISISPTDFSAHGIEVYYATDAQKKQVLAKLSTTLQPKVKNVYRVIPAAQKERFDNYVEKNHITKVKQFWHGSRNENWMSIIRNSLQLNPDAVITGKMFGQGIYFAPSSMKSWNYTSYRGTTWASGKSDMAFMGLYAVAYGKPYDVHTWSSVEDYRHSVKAGHYNCCHAHAGSSLLNDEIVFYDEAAVQLQYIVEFH